MGEALEAARAVAAWLGLRGASGRGSGANAGAANSAPNRASEEVNGSSGFAETP
jgi:hypothetical protein